MRLALLRCSGTAWPSQSQPLPNIQYDNKCSASSQSGWGIDRLCVCAICVFRSHFSLNMASMDVSESSSCLDAAVLESPQQTCWVCLEPVVSPTYMDNCAQACKDSHAACYECVMWYLHEVAKKFDAEGDLENEGSLAPTFKCGMCRVVSTTFSANKVDVCKEVGGGFRHLAQSGVAGQPLQVVATPARDLPPQGPSAEFDIYYIAGVHVRGAHGDVQYKVVWCPKDCAPGDEKFAWGELSVVVGLGLKVTEFHSRWNILPADELPVGFKWEHELPVFSRRKWMCPHDGCGYKTDEWSNCRKHIGSVHSSLKSLNLCKRCDKTFSTKSNLRRHVRDFHIRAVVVMSGPAAASAPAAMEIDE